MGDASRISQQTAGPRPHPSVGPEVRLADGWGRRTNLAQVLRVNKLGKRQEKVAILCSPWMCMDWGRATVPVRQRKCLEAQGCSASSTGARIKDRQVLHRHWMEEVSRTPPPPPRALSAFSQHSRPWLSGKLSSASLRDVHLRTAQQRSWRQPEGECPSYLEGILGIGLGGDESV